MNINTASACTVAFLLCAFAPYASTRVLSTEPVTSVMDVSDLPPPGQNPELFMAAQNLIERYGVDGIVFTDKKLHPGRDILASEAKVLLVSVFSRVSQLGDSVAEGHAGDPVKYAKVKANVKAALAPSGSCRILIGTPYLTKAAKKPLPFKPASLVVRKDILDCLPGSELAPVPGSALKATIARAEMIVQISSALDRVNDKLVMM